MKKLLSISIASAFAIVSVNAIAQTKDEVKSKDGKAVTTKEGKDVTSKAVSK